MRRPSSTSASRRCSGSSTPWSCCGRPRGATRGRPWLRLGVLTLGACVWWMAGLEVEAAYGVNVLKFTETVPSTSATSNASEVFRGLGYWYFYGSDHLGAWTNAAIRYTQHVALIATSYAVPLLALVLGRLRPLARAGLLPGPPLRRAGARRRPVPLHRPHPGRRSPAVLHDRTRRPAWPCDRPTGRRPSSCWRCRCCWPAA